LEPAWRRDPGPSGAAVRVVIAEDSVLLREGLTRLLVERDLDVVGTCDTVDELMAMVRGMAPDVAIVDIRLPPSHSDEGLRAALAIQADHPFGRCAGVVAVRRAGAGVEAADRVG
jgi:DNA-binding NarL/FixJ family response regulator